MTSVHLQGRKTPSTGGQDSQKKDCFLSRKCKINISSQHSPRMHLYTNTCFPGFYLSCYQRHWRTSLFLLHWEPVFPSWTSFNKTSRSHYFSPYQPQRYQWAACSARSRTESSFHLNYQLHVWDTFHLTKPPRATDVLFPLEILFGTVWGPYEQATPGCLSHKYRQDPSVSS